MLKSDKTGMKDALMLSTIIASAVFLVCVLFAFGAYFTMPAGREFFEERPLQIAAIAVLIFAAVFGFSLPWTVGMAFRSSSRNE